MATEATFILYNACESERTPRLSGWQEELEKLKDKFRMVRYNQQGFEEVAPPQGREA